MSLKVKAFFSLWCALLLGSFFALNLYSTQPGESALPKTEWPSETQLSRSPHRAELLLFLHPQCSCSRATVSELERLIPFIHDQAHISVVFFKPEGQSEDWLKSSLWARVKALPEVSVIKDVSGVEAKRFDVKTSGQVILFDQSGHLSFAGGITPARGHEGDNEGSRLIRSLVHQTSAATIAHTSIFGCSFSNPFKKLAGVFL